jgi:hypothetical protein
MRHPDMPLARSMAAIRRSVVRFPAERIFDITYDRFDAGYVSIRFPFDKSTLINYHEREALSSGILRQAQLDYPYFAHGWN